jgi:hypothetical protein
MERLSACGRGGLQDGVDDLLGHPVGDAQVRARDDHETDHHARRLEDLAAVGPLDALQLGPAGRQELDEARPTAPGRGGLPA